MNKFTALFGTMTALALAPAAANAATVIVPIGSLTPTHFFFLTSDPTDLSTIAANFGATTSGKNTMFDYSFEVTLPYTGVGSASLSTSYAMSSLYLDVTKVIVDGITYTPTPLTPGATKGGQILSAQTIGDIAITAGVLNTIEVFGTTGSSTKTGTFTGTLTFAASAVPEPASWAMMLLGMGMVGVAARARRQKRSVAFT